MLEMERKNRTAAKALIIKDGKIELFDKVDMKEKFPQEWPKWLGW